MRVRLTSQPFFRVCPGEHTHHFGDAGIASGLQIQWRVANAHDLRRRGDTGFFHRATDHVRSGTAFGYVAAGHVGIEGSRPSGFFQG